MLTTRPGRPGHALTRMHPVWPVRRYWMTSLGRPPPPPPWPGRSDSKLQSQLSGPELEKLFLELGVLAKLEIISRSKLQPTYRLGLALRHFARFLMKMLGREKGLTSLYTLGGNHASHVSVYFQIFFGLCRDSELSRLVEAAHTDNRQHVSQSRLVPYSHCGDTATGDAGDRPTHVMSASRRSPVFHCRKQHPMPRLQIQQHFGLQARLQEERDKIDVHRWRHHTACG